MLLIHDKFAIVLVENKDMVSLKYAWLHLSITC